MVRCLLKAIAIRIVVAVIIIVYKGRSIVKMDTPATTISVEGNRRPHEWTIFIVVVEATFARHGPGLPQWWYWWVRDYYDWWWNCGGGGGGVRRSFGGIPTHVVRIFLQSIGIVTTVSLLDGGGGGGGWIQRHRSKGIGQTYHPIGMVVLVVVVVVVVWMIGNGRTGGHDHLGW